MARVGEAMRPLAVDLFAGLFGWGRGAVKEGYRVIGVDIEDMCARLGEPMPEHTELIIGDVRSIHGSRFKDAALLMGSSPCQEFSYRSMPWKRAKALGPPELGMELFHAQFRIQREASEAAGRFIPMVVENVRGAIPYVGRSKWNCGSLHFWGDVPALMPSFKHVKVQSFRFDGSGASFQTAAVSEHVGRRTAPGNRARFMSRDCGPEGAQSRWFNDGPRSPDSISSSSSSSSSPARKAASARVAMIPEEISRHIARVYKPTDPGDVI